MKLIHSPGNRNKGANYNSQLNTKRKVVKPVIQVPELWTSNKTNKGTKKDQEPQDQFS